MRFLSVVLPFVAIFVAAIGVALGSAFQEVSWFKWLGLGLATFLLGIWVYIDFQTLKVLFRRKGTSYDTSAGITIIGVLAIIIGLGFLTNRPRFNKQFDATQKGVNTLSDASKEYIGKLKESKTEIEVLAFFQDEAQKNEFQSLSDLYQRAGAQLKIKFIDPEREPILAQSEKLTAANTVILRSGEREARLTAFTEEKLTNALVNVMKDGGKKVYFIAGHGEGETSSQEGKGFQAAAQLLESQKIEVQTLQLLETGAVPKDADVLVLAGSAYDLKEQEVAFLKSYLEGGGALVVAIDAMREVKNLNNLLSNYGLQLEDDLVIMNPNDPRAQLYGQNNGIIGGFNKTQSVTRDMARRGSLDLMLPFLRTIKKTAELEGQSTESLAKTSKAVVRINGVKSESDLKNLTEDRLSNDNFDALMSASRKVKTDAGDKEMRLVVVGSSYLINNQGLTMSAAHRDLFSSTFSWLIQDGDFISVPTKEQAESTLSMSTGGALLSYYGLSYIYPFCFLGLAIIYWMRRRSA